jgi:hypothetical protein
MMQAAVAKFYGCSPVDVRDLTVGEYDAAMKLADELTAD